MQSTEKKRDGTIVRLHLGCGQDVRKGYINIDKFDTRCSGVIQGDMLDLAEFDDESVDEILMIEVIEHLDFKELEIGLREWQRVLKPEGFLHTECPDILEIAKKIVEEDLTDPLMYDIWGQYYRPWDEEHYGADILQGMFHKQGFTKKRIEWLAKEHGFSRIEDIPFKDKQYPTPLSLAVRWYK